MDVNRFGTVVKLNGSNYQIWKYKVELLLLKEELWDVVEEDPPAQITNEWKNKDGKARATIGLLIDDNQVIHIRQCKTAKETWNCLRNYHEKSTLTNKVFLLKRLCRSTMAEYGNMEEHIANIMEIINQLSTLGENLADKLQVAFLLSSLPESYESLVTALESRAEKDITIEMVKEKLIQEYRKRQENGNSMEEKQTAMKINKNQKKFFRKSQESNEKSEKSEKRLCHFCKKPNHVMKDCYFYKNHLKKVKMVKAPEAKEDNVEDNEEFCFKIGEKALKNDWYIDSGASTHMTNDESFFENFVKSKTSVELADGRKTISYGHGDGIIFAVNKGNSSVKIRIKDVLLIPTLETNLLSVKKLTERGYDLEFNKARCDIKYNGRIVAVGKICNNLYKLVTSPNKALATWDKSESCCIHLWHKRFGHKDVEVVKDMNKKNMVDGMNLKQCSEFMACETCITNKMKRKPFPKKSSHQSKEILELVHTDVCGPMQTQTPGGRRYVLTLIDDYSRFAVVYLMSKKEQVREKLQEYVQMVNNQFNKKPKTIRSDRGGEYMAESVEEFLKSNGISHNKTSPYSPQQNGVAEKKNQDLIGMARCMLYDAKLPYKYWGEAVMTANYILNRSLSRATNRIPAEDWSGRRVNVNNIRSFGSIAYMKIPDEKRKKLDPKAQKLTLVGYEDGSKAYRLMDKSTGKIYISRDVTFVEESHSQLHPVNIRKNDEQSTTKEEEFRANEVEIIFKNNVNSKNQNNTLQSDDSVMTNDNFDISNSIDSEPDCLSNTFANNPVCSNETSIITKDAKDILSDDNFEDAMTSPDGEEIRRSTRPNKGHPPPKYHSFFHKDPPQYSSEPNSVLEAKTGGNFDQWKKAMDEEIGVMLKNDTWNLVELPEGRKAIGSKWVFKIKHGSNGQQKYKARLVARGFTQKYGEDYDEIFAPVVRPNSVRLLFTMASTQQMSIYHYDFKSAFLNSDIDAEIYMKQPEGYVELGKELLVCKLNKSIYGLKQAARTWNSTINDALIEIGFRRGTFDLCLYTKGQPIPAYALIYVDDVLLASKSTNHIKEIAAQLENKFDILCLGEVSNFLGMEVKKNEQGIFSICQENYISKLLNRYRLEDSKTSKIPMDIGFAKLDNSEDELFENPEMYQSAVGALLYLSVNSRPDISIAISILGRRVSNPRISDWTELKRVLKYLKATINTKINFNGSKSGNLLVGYADADWAGERADRKSNSGYIFFFNGSLIDWRCRKQDSVSLSSTEAEFISLAEACQEAIYLEGVLKDFQVNSLKIEMYEDNQSCLKMLDQERTTDRTKHIDTKYNFIKDLKKKQQIEFKYCPTDSMLADFLTKPLSGTKIQDLLAKIGMSK